VAAAVWPGTAQAPASTNPDGSFTLPPEYQQKTPQLDSAWRDRCARYDPSGQIEIHP
jgi:hypothetical protein